MNKTANPTGRRGISRRRLLQTAGAAGATIAAAPIFAPAVHAQSASIKIGYVTPQSGPLAAFAQSDEFNVTSFLETVKDGVSIGGNTYSIEVVVKDSQSNPNRAAEVAKELIVDDEIDLMLVASTPETTNPVSTTCEIEQMPCVSTMAPWQPWFIGRQADPAGGPPAWTPVEYTYHYFWGLEDVIAVFLNMWNQLDTNKVVGGLFPNDGDGNAWGDPVNGVPPAFAAAGYTTIDPGRYQNLTDDFSAQITAFKDAGAEIVTGVVLPPDFTTFWNQASQQGFKPKAVTVAKAILFPESVEVLGAAGNNLSSEVWWSPNHPFKSSLTGQTAAELATAFEAAASRQWTQPIGFIHSLFEVALDVVKRAADPNDPQAILASIAATNLETVVGPVRWDGANVPPFAAKNVTKTPLVGGQWRQRPDNKFDLVIVDNKTAPNIPAGGTMEAIA
jgi:branched-chain amino acid transport system substrate-binding protein